MPRDIPLTETRFAVENLSCGSCVARAEKALSGAPGVSDARVNLATKRAQITTEGPADLAAIAAVMDRVGYPIRADRPAGGEAAKREEDVEAQTLWRNFLIAAALTLPVFVLEMGAHLFPPFHHWIAQTIGIWPSWFLQFVLTTVVLAGPGAVFYRKGIPALLRGAPEMNALVVMGTFAAWSYSTVVTFAPGLIPEASRFVYFEAAAVIVTLILLGRFLEARARGRAGAAIARLMDLRPDRATLLVDGRERDIAVADIQPGDILRLRPGERVAVDGEVVEGTSHVDESMISGEPVPVAKASGDSVTGGTVNGGGSISYRTTRVGADTVLAQIVTMVENAQATRLPIQSLINRITGVFVPVVLTIAVLAAGLWLAFGPDPINALVIGVSVLIIACPCAMGLATPVSIMAGTGRAAELGILFRKGDALQGLGRVDIVALDKTGTLTVGAPRLAELEPAEGTDPDDLLRCAAAVEARSEHPLAQAIVAAARARGLDLPEATGFASTSGAGVAATVEGTETLIGTEAFLAANGVNVPDLAASPHSIVHVARNGVWTGRLTLADLPKPGAAATVAALKSRGLKVIMVSGDAEAPVKAVAEELGLDAWHARLRPEDKLALIKELSSAGHKVAFVGDGINDAPVLAAADVGIAIGNGTDVAIEAADVILVSGNPAGVVTAIEASRRTMNNIAQNLVWAFGYNVALIPVAAGALALFGGPLLSPMLAAGAMAASSVLVVTNALRLRRMKGANA